MYQVKASIVGIAPILFDKMTDRAKQGIVDGGNLGNLTDAEKRAMAPYKVYRNGHGLYIPYGNLKKCVLEGSTKAGLKHAGKALWGFLAPTMFFQERELLLNKEEPEFIWEEMVSIPPGKKGAKVMDYRPGLEPGWSVSFNLRMFDERVTPQLVRRAFDEAGLLIGVCNHRPDFGRFEVNDWEISKDS